MKKRLDFHKNFFNNREIVLWGTGEIGGSVAQALKEEKIDFSFSVSNDNTKDSFCGKPVLPKTILNRSEHYVIVSTKYFDEVKTELADLGYVEKIDYYCWGKYYLDYDFIYDGVPIGRNFYDFGAFSSYMGESGVDFIESVGRFTSINPNAQVNIDHNMKALSTGCFSFITKEDSLLYSNKYEHTRAIKNRIKIGNDVWIGSNALINCSKIKSIGNGAVIGAGTIVLDDVPPYAVVVGVPGKIIKYRFTEEQIEILERVKWWDWDEKKLKEHAECFYNPDMFFELYGE